MTYWTIYMETCHRCKKFIQDTDPNKDYCTGSDECYALAGFPEYEPKETEINSQMGRS